MQDIDKYLSDLYVSNANMIDREFRIYNMSAPVMRH